MHAFLYIGGSGETRLAAIEEAVTRFGIPRFDQRRLIPTEKASVGIADVRAFIQTLSLTPQTSNGSAGIIPDMSALTTEAQQALLKTIEEPPMHVRLFLASASETQVLPTIVSRCQTTPCSSGRGQWSQQDLDTCAGRLTSLTSQTPGALLTTLSEIAPTRDDAKRFIDCATMVLYTSVRLSAQTETPRNLTRSTRLLHELLRAKKLTGVNVNAIQLLEHIFLTHAV